MKNTKKNVVELLESMNKHYHAMARMYKEEGNEAQYNEYIAKAIEVSTAVNLLTKPEFFDAMAEIFLEK